MKPPDTVVFFLDRSLGKKVIADKLRQAGMLVEVHDDHFAQDCTDEHWLREAGKKGWLVLTKDKRIRYRTAERLALQVNGVKAFVLTGGDLTGAEMAETFLKTRAKIERMARIRSGPFIATITKRGEVRLIST